jgi:hypothetical protein
MIFQAPPAVLLGKLGGEAVRGCFARQALPGRDEGVRMKMRWLLGLGGVGACVASFAPGAAHAVVIHPADDGVTVPGPAASVVGRWGGNASAVAVAPNHILTTRHQGGGVGTMVVFGGTTYEVAEIVNVEPADLRIARITTPGGAGPANLGAFTPLYTGPDVVQNFTLGGFGRGRGANLTTTGGTYGYAWNGDGNTTLRFGRNRLETAGNAVDSQNGYTSAVVGADFDAPGTGNAVAVEAIPPSSTRAAGGSSRTARATGRSPPSRARSATPAPTPPSPSSARCSPATSTPPCSSPTRWTACA